MRSIVTHVDTRRVPPARRFAYWLDEWSRAVMPLKVRSEHEADFVATTRWIDLGVLRIGLHRYPPLAAARTRQLIRDTDAELLHLVVNVGGEMTVTQRRRDVRLGADEFTVLDGRCAFRVAHTAGRHAGRPASIIVPVARDLVALSPDRLGQILASRMSGRYGTGALLTRFLRQLTRHPHQYRPSDAARLGTITLDLLAVSLGHDPEPDLGTEPVRGAEADLGTGRDRGTEPAPPSGDRPEQATLARVHAFIERNLRDPNLSPRTIAAAHHISTRTLHRIFGTSGHTVAGWVRTRRLERCRRDLADATMRVRPIQAIAAGWSFRDKAHFSRAFRAEYGISPQAFRRSLVEDPA